MTAKTLPEPVIMAQQHSKPSGLRHKLCRRQFKLMLFNAFQSYTALDAEIVKRPGRLRIFPINPPLHANDLDEDGGPGLDAKP